MMKYMSHYQFQQPVVQTNFTVGIFFEMTKSAYHANYQRSKCVTKM